MAEAHDPNAPGAGQDQAVDPMMAMFMDNPPKDALEFRAMLDGFAMALNNDLPEIGESVDDVVIQAHEGQDLTVDIHRPVGEGPFPVLVYLHGGGWIMGTPKTHRRLGFRFAEAGYLVFNVHYRLAPEAPFPAAYDDCLTALEWVIDNAANYGGDASRLAMGGDSAGGNLTAAVAAHDTARRIKATLLIYPALDFAAMDAEGATIPGTDINLMEMMVGSYIGHDRENLKVDPRVSPILAADRMPATHVLCGTADALIDDCRRLAERLVDAGIDHETFWYDDMPHAFTQMEEMYPQARESIDRMIGFLNARLS